MHPFTVIMTEDFTLSVLLHESNKYMYRRFSGIVDAAIKKVLEQRQDVNVSHNLTPQDVFYREVSPPLVTGEGRLNVHHC